MTTCQQISLDFWVPGAAPDQPKGRPSKVPRAYEEKGASEGKKEDGDEAYEGQNESFKRIFVS
jgi:hypothetical protein